MSHVVAVFVIWVMSIFGINNCEPIKGMESVSICIEVNVTPPPPPPVQPPGPGAGTVAISNGF